MTEHPTHHVALVDLLEAYHSCRRTKRRTMSALAFEVDYESELLALRDDINAGIYQPRRSIAFIVDQPVKREIFAADFRDRVVHHLLINKLNPAFERAFIYDSYACRVGKGTLFGVRRLERFIRQCSHNDTRDCYVLKLDIKGFFMHINTRLLLQRLEAFIDERYDGPDVELVRYLSRVVLLSRPSDHCVIRGRRSDWDGLPADKSLFHSPPDCGLPIGNYSSQVFANFYLNGFDHFVKHDLGVRFYGRYVDDFVLVHESREHLASLVPVIRAYLADELGLQLHPRKMILQHHGHGVPFLGAFVRPNRTYAGRRITANFSQALLRHQTAVAHGAPTRTEQEAFRSSVNSYLGWLGQFDTFRYRRHMLRHRLPGWWRYGHVSGDLSRFVLRRRPAPVPMVGSQGGETRRGRP